jgi:hypothetical protein
MSVIRESIMYVDCTAASPERGLTPVRCPRRTVIDCTTPEDALRTTKRAREDLELVCPDAPKKARVAREMMVSPFAARLFPPPVSVRLHYTSDGAVKVVLSYNNEC